MTKLIAKQRGSGAPGPSIFVAPGWDLELDFSERLGASTSQQRTPTRRLLEHAVLAGQKHLELARLLVQQLVAEPLLQQELQKVTDSDFTLAEVLYVLALKYLTSNFTVTDDVYLSLVQVLAEQLGVHDLVALELNRSVLDQLALEVSVYSQELVLQSSVLVEDELLAEAIRVLREAPVLTEELKFDTWRRLVESMLLTETLHVQLELLGSEQLGFVDELLAHRIRVYQEFLGLTEAFVYMATKSWVEGLHVLDYIAAEFDTILQEELGMLPSATTAVFDGLLGTATLSLGERLTLRIAVRSISADNARGTTGTSSERTSGAQTASGSTGSTQGGSKRVAAASSSSRTIGRATIRF